MDGEHEHADEPAACREVGVIAAAPRARVERGSNAVRRRKRVVRRLTIAHIGLTTEVSRPPMTVSGLRLGVLIVDDHPAMRAGVATVLEHRSEFAVLGTVDGGRELELALSALQPDVVLMDFDLRDEDGIILCHRVKRQRRRIGVVVYSAFADDLVAAAMLAHADALLSKRAGAAVLCDALRDAALETGRVPVLPAFERQRLGALLSDEEMSLAALLLSKRPAAAVAKATGMTVPAMHAATERLLERVVDASVRGGHWS